MYARLKLKIILTVQLVLPASTSDLMWPSNEDLLFSDTSLSFGQTLFSDSTNLSQNQEAFFEELDSGNVWPLSDTDGLTGSPFSDDAWDRTFELAGCSSSENLSAMDKSRVRRLNKSEKCKNSAVELHSSNEDVFKERVDLLGGDLDILKKLTETIRNKAANTRCVFYTLSILPWGVCSSGWPPDEIATGESVSIPTRGVFSLYRLEYYNLGKR